jgi:predicted MFS family arabinose efflux permease
MKNRKNALLLVLMSLILVVLNSDTNVMAPNLARIEAYFGNINDADLGLMMGLFTVVGALISILFGYFSDKFNRKHLFIFAIALGEIPCFLTALSPSYAAFFTLRILCGIGVGAAFPLVFSIVGDMFSQERRPAATAILTTAYAVGNIVGTLVGGYCSSADLWRGSFLGAWLAPTFGDSIGWRIPFILAAAPNFVLIAVFGLFIPTPRAAASEEATAELVAQGVLYPKKVRLADYLELAKTKTNVGLFIQGILGTVPWGAMFFLNIFLEQDRGLSTTAATTVYLVFGIGMIVGTVAGGFWGGALGKKRPAAIPLFCAVTTAMGLVFVMGVFWIEATIPVLCAIGFVAAFFVAMTSANMRTMLLDVNRPEQRGPIFSIFNLTDSVGQGAGKWIAGLLTLSLSRTMSLTACSLFWLGCAVVLGIVASFFGPDIARLKASMAKIASEMKRAK